MFCCVQECVFVYQGDCTCSTENILIASCQGQSLRCAMCGMSEGLRLQCLQPTPESRAHCVAAEGEQRHFHWRNFGFLSIRRAVPWARAVFICLCTVGIYGAAEGCTFQTTSGGCINSHIKGREKIPPDDRDSRPEWSVCVYWGSGFGLRHVLTQIWTRIPFSNHLRPATSSKLSMQYQCDRPNVAQMVLKARFKCLRIPLIWIYSLFMYTLIFSGGRIVEHYLL